MLDSKHALIVYDNVLLCGIAGGLLQQKPKVVILIEIYTTQYHYLYS